jgi:PAS domain S-box-containing protein
VTKVNFFHKIVRYLIITNLKPGMWKKPVIYFKPDFFLSDEEFYGLIFHNLKNYAIILLDPDGYIISWNKGVEIMKGYKKEDVLHNHFSILYGTENIRENKPNNDLRQAIVDGMHEEESIWIRKNGAKIFASISITALINAKGELRGFSMIVKDITKSRKSDEKLIGHNYLFKSIMQEKTSELIKLKKQYRRRLTVVKEMKM